MIKQIIKNEIKDVLGHEPSDLEYKSAMEYLNDNISEKDFLVDISLALHDWRSSYCVKCQGCGEYFLTEDCIKSADMWFCDESCRNEYCWETGSLYDSDADCFIEE